MALTEQAKQQIAESLAILERAGIGHHEARTLRDQLCLIVRAMLGADLPVLQPTNGAGAITRALAAQQLPPGQVPAPVTIGPNGVSQAVNPADFNPPTETINGQVMGNRIETSPGVFQYLPQIAPAPAGMPAIAPMVPVPPGQQTVALQQAQAAVQAAQAQLAQAQAQPPAPVFIQPQAPVQSKTLEQAQAEVTQGAEGLPPAVPEAGVTPEQEDLLRKVLSVKDLEAFNLG